MQIGIHQIKDPKKKEYRQLQVSALASLAIEKILTVQPIISHKYEW